MFKFLFSASKIGLLRFIVWQCTALLQVRLPLEEWALPGVPGVLTGHPHCPRRLHSRLSGAHLPAQQASCHLFFLKLGT
jgi:hypothetical protein